MRNGGRGACRRRCGWREARTNGRGWSRWRYGGRRWRNGRRGRLHRSRCVPRFGLGFRRELHGHHRWRGCLLTHSVPGRFACACRWLAESALPASGLQPRDQLTSAGGAIVGVALRPPQRLAGARCRGVAPVTNLAGAALRRVAATHLDTADKIAVPAPVLGSLRREGGARRPESKRQDRECPAVARHQISTNSSPSTKLAQSGQWVKLLIARGISSRNLLKSELRTATPLVALRARLAQPVPGPVNSHDLASSGRLRLDRPRSRTPPRSGAARARWAGANLRSSGLGWHRWAPRCEPAYRSLADGQDCGTSWVAQPDLSGRCMLRLARRAAGCCDGTSKAARRPLCSTRRRSRTGTDNRAKWRFGGGAQCIPPRDAGNAATAAVVQPASDRTRWTRSLRSSCTRSMRATNRASPWS